LAFEIGVPVTLMLQRLYVGAF